MIETIKKTIFAGLGATVISAERIRAKLDELVEKGKISAKEAQDMTGKIVEEGRKEFEDSASKISTIIDDTLRKANFARQHDYEILLERVEKLEALVAKLAAEPVEKE